MRQIDDLISNDVDIMQCCPGSNVVQDYRVVSTAMIKQPNSLGHSIITHIENQPYSNTTHLYVRKNEKRRQATTNENHLAISSSVIVTWTQTICVYTNTAVRYLTRLRLTQGVPIDLAPLRMISR